MNLNVLPERTESIEVPEEASAESYWRFTNSRIRVETYDQYGVPDDDQMLTQYLAGVPCPIPDAPWNEWFARNRKNADEGKDLTRIHVVPSQLTPYLRYEIEIGYSQYNVPSGEKIFIVVKDDVPRLRSLPSFDFYVFDDERVMAVDYTTEGRFIALRDEGGQAMLEWCRAHVEDLMSHAVTLQQFLAKMRATGFNVG